MGKFDAAAILCNLQVKDGQISHKKLPFFVIYKSNTGDFHSSNRHFL